MTTKDQAHITRIQKIVKEEVKGEERVTLTKEVQFTQIKVTTPEDQEDPDHKDLQTLPKIKLSLSQTA